MPAYILHGFRWPRDGITGIRIHVIMNNIDDCSSEYIQNEHSRDALLISLRQQFPELLKELEQPGRRLEFIEQYDPEDESDAALPQPYAYVADKVVELAGQTLTPSPTASDKAMPSTPLLSANVEEIIAAGYGSAQNGKALAELRDKIAPGETVGWWVAYNGDPERWYDSEEAEEEEDEEATTPTAEFARSTSTAHPLRGNTVASNSQAGPPVPPKEIVPASSHMKNKPLPTRAKPPEGTMPLVIPPAVLPSPKNEQIPEPPKLKEVAKASGFRKKFFGRKV